jgi:hypothetical protein
MIRVQVSEVGNCKIFATFDAEEDEEEEDQESSAPNAARRQSHENVKASNGPANDRILQTKKNSAKKRTVEAMMRHSCTHDFR